MFDLKLVNIPGTCYYATSYPVLYDVCYNVFRLLSIVVNLILYIILRLSRYIFGYGLLPLGVNLIMSLLCLVAKPTISCTLLVFVFINLFICCVNVDETF
jgi:hypothetical protein